MPASEAYGEAFGRRLNAQATSFTARSLGKAAIAVTELRYSRPQDILSRPPPPEDAFMVGVHLSHYAKYEYWEDGRAFPATSIRAGETVIYDLKRHPIFRMNSEFHTVHFYLPRAALDMLAEEAESGRVDELHYRPSISRADPVLCGMANALRPAFSHPERINKLLLDHAMLAVGHHVACAYGDMQPFRRATRGGLTPFQERRAKEIIAANLANDLALATVARECGLSVSQFGKAFRKSVGMPPHRWLVQQRVALAKSLLRQRMMTLAEIALACGFSDQSHFTQCFSSWTGTSPGAFRRSVQHWE
jgi:AraC-like DNA-binding protein